MPATVAMANKLGKPSRVLVGLGSTSIDDMKSQDIHPDIVEQYLVGVGSGAWPADDNPLRGAPHTAECLLVENWEHPYTREQAAYPMGKGFRPKVRPPVRRVDSAYGDRNLVCSCPPVEAFA